MKTLYFLFEKIPNPQSGGLITMYRRLEILLSDTYNIKIISIFDCPPEYKNQFSSECIVVNRTELDNRFLRIGEYIKKLKIKKILECIASMIKYFIYIPRTRKKLTKIIDEHDVTMVSCPAAAVFMTSERKFILEIHSKFDYFWNGNISAKLQVKLMTSPTLVLFRNKTDAEKGKKYFPSDYVYNFFDNKEIKRNKNYDKKRGKFIFIGRFNEDKDVLRLLKIINNYVKDNKNIILDMYGQGPLEKEIRNFIDINELNHNVFLKGYTSDKNVYASYSALLMTSKREGFPLTIIEAKANGIPTITTRWGEAVNETIRSGVDGYIVNDDAEFMRSMNTISNDTCLLASLSENAYQDFERFSCDKAKREYIRFIDNIYKLK